MNEDGEKMQGQKSDKAVCERARGMSEVKAGKENQERRQSRGY